jgi:hypothetical protein
MPARPQKITFAEMHETGVHGLLIYCADFRCRHSIAIRGDLSEIEPRFVCRACGKARSGVLRCDQP